MACFLHFDFEMCFAPQSHALFQQLSFQKCFEPEVFAPIIRHVLPAAAACTFSTPQFPKVLCSGQFFFTIFTSKCASRHFRPSGAAKLEKNTLSRDFSTFSRALTFFLLISLSDLFSTDSLFFDFFSFLTVLVTAAASLHESEI